jgi:hypothetical protein
MTVVGAASPESSRTARRSVALAIERQETTSQRLKVRKMVAMGEV